MLINTYPGFPHFYYIFKCLIEQNAFFCVLCLKIAKLDVNNSVLIRSKHLFPYLNILPVPKNFLPKCIKFA